MKTKKFELNGGKRLKTAAEMSDKELCRWMALMNMLKFINLGEAICREVKKEEEVHQKCMERYILDVSGDLMQYLKDYRGIPFKYSLDPKHSESKSIGEVDLFN